MNRFTLTTLRNILFAVFLTAVAVLLLLLFLAPCFRSDTSENSGMDIPAVVYISDADVSATDVY